MFIRLNKCVLSPCMTHTLKLLDTHLYTQFENMTMLSLYIFNAFSSPSASQDKGNEFSLVVASCFSLTDGSKGTTPALFLIKWLGLYMLRMYRTIIHNKRGTLMR